MTICTPKTHPVSNRPPTHLLPTAQACTKRCQKEEPTRGDKTRRTQQPTIRPERSNSGGAHGKVKTEAEHDQFGKQKCRSIKKTEPPQPTSRRKEKNPGARHPTQTQKHHPQTYPPLYPHSPSRKESKSCFARPGGAMTPCGAVDAAQRCR